VGGLDERFFMYTEDVDLCTSVRARGRQVLFIPQAEILHLRGRSAGRNPDTERLRRQSHLAFYEKHLPRWATLLRLYLRLTGKTGHA
jgi:N-acetylglucosaminyl-diphospho-decaprenol L-rhamnosyltransferase